MDKTFEPRYTAGRIVTTGTSSANITLGFSSESLCLTNLGSVVIYIRVGNNGVVASTADYPLLPSSQVSIGKDQDENTVAFISPDGAGSLHVIPGLGF